MRTYTDSMETLRLKVEASQPLKARFKQKIHVRHMDGNDLIWEGDVFAFGLTYDSKQNASTKEEIANWQLAGPTEKSLKAAVQLGDNLRKKLESTSDRKVEIWRKSKLAYAWSSSVKGSTKRKINVVLQEGTVKSPVDAVKSVIGKGKK